MAKKKSSSRGGRKPGKWVHVTKDSLREFRKTASYSRTKLAGLLGVSPTSVQNWETGKSVPMKRYQELLAGMIDGGTAPAAGNGSAERASLPSADGPVQAARFTATGEILKGFLATPKGGRLSQDELVALTKALSGALA